MSGYCEQCGNTICICDEVANKGSLINRAEEAFESAKKREWEGLTDEEIERGYETTGHYQTLRPQDRFAVFALARAIEAKLKEKNA